MNILAGHIKSTTHSSGYMVSLQAPIMQENRWDFAGSLDTMGGWPFTYSLYVRILHWSVIFIDARI